MLDQTLIYFGPGPAPYGTPFTIKDNWPELSKKAWLDALFSYGYIFDKTPFIPTYEKASVSWPSNDGHVISTPLSEYELPTLVTCQYIAKLYGFEVVEVPYFGPGPVFSSAKRRYFQCVNKKGILDASQLAQYYTNNPPSIADNLCKLLIAQVWPS